ncbi:glycosyltransferase [Clostridium sporogenes]|uniref:glycosyltransferase n=1 Tax=Clostridium sporogenes TaxID=1509 RepID=UPI0013C8DE9C|nr:glycosyltransferase [Clostridium sporogenes]NFF64904.1 glycosyltransferase [Clostridium sporogenes]
MELNLSVAIPCYNCEKYIKKTIKTLLKQTILPQEIILVNDNSSDDTIKVLEEIQYGNEEIIRVFNLTKNKGPSFARNYAVDKSNGDYILFMDSDDLASPYLIEKSLTKLKEMNEEIHDKWILSYTSYIQIDENDNIISDIIKGIQVDPEEILAYEFLRNYISTSGVMVKKHYFYKAGKFNEKLSHSEDWDLWLRIAALGGFSYVNEPLVKVRRRENSLSSNLKNMKEGEKTVLNQYSLDFIEEVVNKRKVSSYINTCDFVSMLFRLDYWEEGLKRLKYLAKNSYYYNIYFLLGLYYIKNHNLKLALDNFNKTINLKQNHGAALNNLGAIYCLLGQIDQGKQLLSKALEIFPNYLDAIHNLNLVINKSNVTYDNINFTWRELRNTLINYKNK